MAESPTEKRVRDVEKSIVSIDTTLRHLRDDVDSGKRDEKETAKTVAELQKELAVLKKDFEELKERIKTKEAWLRGLIASVIVASLTSVVALIVALARK